jgi:hypothetical protein
MNMKKTALKKHLVLISQTIANVLVFWCNPAAVDLRLSFDSQNISIGPPGAEGAVE